jgi:hypothetical protein
MYLAGGVVLYRGTTPRQSGKAYTNVTRDEARL